MIDYGSTIRWLLRAGAQAQCHPSIARIMAKHDPQKDRALVAHWQSKDIKISSRPAQIAICDGEILGKEKLHAKIIPEAVEVLVPKKAAS